MNCRALRVGKAAAPDRVWLTSDLPFSACCWYDNKHALLTGQFLSLCHISLHPDAIALVKLTSIQRQRHGLASLQQTGSF